MSDRNRQRAPRRTLLLLGAGLGVMLAGATAIALVSGLAIADQPGRSLQVPALDIQPNTAGPTAALPPVATGAATERPASPSTTSGPELVPAPPPVDVDDRGGDRPGHDDKSGSGSD